MRRCSGECIEVEGEEVGCRGRSVLKGRWIGRGVEKEGEFTRQEGVARKEQ